MTSRVEVTLEAIPFIKKSDDLADHCVHRAKNLSRTIRDDPNATIPLSDRFYLMSRGYIPFVTRPKWSCRDGLPVTVVAYTMREDQTTLSRLKFPTHNDDTTSLASWTKLGG
ncbi:hypothetical protein RB195_003066 [Necator americanus]|uniref:Uncharacterized protein n=1 Tax=Necator americanus TaxID=51031 RepID=A0ABR1DLW4_NECAM